MDYLFAPFDFLERIYSTNKNPFSKEKVKKGKIYAKNCHCIVGSLLRDAEDSYQYGVNMIEILSKIFKTVDVFILENDSKDNTKKLWKKYAKTCHENVKVFVDSPSENDQYLRQKTNNHEITEQRIKKMVKLRNILLDNIKEKSRKVSYDKYIFMTDLDIKGKIKKEGIYDTFYHFRKKKIDAIGCNGLLWNCFYFDNFAYKNSSSRNGVHPSIIVPINDNLFPVISTFSGGVFYKYNVITQLKYKFKRKEGKIICEHVTLNEKIKDIYINTNMIYNIISH